ncbi:MAG: hypothetical protein ACTHJR_01995 [Sphingomonas sp.]|uniref:hypothetical protein n=1 Tax=Sphingomonas sp. TaxID=28214 RepID=UPI003F7F9D7F
MIAALALLVASAQSAGVPADRFDALIGSWTCHGHFIKSGAPLASRLAIARDPGTATLIVHHDDLPPTTYKSLETWTMLADGSFRASVASIGAMRWYGAAGWQGDTLAWSRSEGGAPVEQFAYTLTGPGKMRIDWSIARGGPLVLGDTLDCVRG